MAFRKIEAGLVHSPVDNYIGKKGTIFYDNDDGILRLSDGRTPGGTIVSGGSGSGSYTLPTATTTVKGGIKIDGTTISIDNGVISGFSGSYTDLSNKPTIPSNTSQLTNGAGYITSASLPTTLGELTNDVGYLEDGDFDLNTIDFDASNKLHATGILPGDTDGFTAIFAGRAAGVAALPNTVIQSQAQVNDYAQNNFQNTNDGVHASTEWVATSPNGDDSNYYIDLGINGASWDGTAANSLYTNVGQRDGWVYVQGGNAGGGNLVLGTSLDNTYTKIISGDASAGDTEVARFSSTEIKLKKQLTFSDNTTQTTAWLGTYSYNNLTDTPTLVTSYNDLTDLPTLITSYNELANLPTLFSGSYTDLTDKPTLFSGSYNDLTDVPSAPIISLGDLTDVDLTTPPTIGQVLKFDGTKWAPGTDITSGGSGTDADTLDGFDSSYFLNYNNLTNKPTIPTTVTVNGTAITLGSSGTITASTTNALTISTGLKGTASTFDGSAAVTVSLDTTVTTITATAGATTTLSAATLTPNYIISGTISGTHVIRLPDLTTLTAGQRITFNVNQGTIAFQLSTGTSIVSNTTTLSRLITFTVLSNAANTTANVYYTYSVPGITGSGTSLVTNSFPNISGAYITGLDSTTSTTAYASTPTLTFGASSTAFNTTLNMYTAALVATWSKTINFGTGLNGGTSTINIGTGVTSGTATVNIGSSTSTVQMNGAVTITSLTATNSIVGSITGNAATATKLGTARTINNVSFDGSASITVKADTNNALTIGSGLSGTSFDGSTAVTIAVDSTVALRADTHYIGTTSIALNRTSSSQTLTGVSIDGNAATVTNGVYTSGTYSDPAWITSLAYSKISGAPTIPVNVSELTNDSGYATLTGIETLTNKTLTLPTIGGTGATFNGSSSGTTVLKASSAAGTTTITLPARTGTVITSGDTGTVTNAMLEGNIANAKLFNSRVTIGSTVIDLGTTAANLEGLNSVTATNFVGNATTATKLATARNINGVSFDGTAAITITANTTNALTIGTGLSGTSFNGSGAVTIAIDSTVATLTGSQTLTNKTLTLPTISGTGATFNGSTSGTTVLKASATAGSTTVTMPATTGTLITTGDSGTVTNTMLAGSIANSKLANSAITINGSAISLGGSTTISSITAVGYSTSLGFDAAGNLILSNGTYFRAPSGLTIQTGGPSPYYNWTFNNDGTVALPSNKIDTGTSSAIIQSNGSSASSSIYWKTSTGGGAGVPYDTTVQADDDGITLRVTSGTISVRSVTQWTLNAAGQLTFPDSSVQSTAYTGNAATVTNGVYTTDTGTVTNTMLAGSIANNKLANSSITVNGSATALGGSVTISTITGNAGTATTLQTARNINGVSFNGSADITVTAAAGTLTGTTLNSTVVSSSLTSVGTLTGLAVTTTATGNAVNVTYTPPSATGAAYFATGKDTAGGTGYFDFLRATNTTSGVTNATKTFRVNSVGTLEILNSAYNATILSVTDAGFIAINASSTATNGVPVNNGIAMGNNSYIFDDGNYHITTKTGQIWLNSNDGSAVSINQQMPNGITPGGLKVTGPVNAQSAYYGRTPWNSALDTEVTIDDYRFRVSNQGGNFPQVISNTGGTKNSAWTAVAARSGSAITQTGSTGNLVPNNSWVSLYASAGMDSAGDTVVVTLQDKNQGRIYRVTFMRSDNGATTGYNIIAERLL